MHLLFIIPTALFAAAAFFTYRERGWVWVSIGLACATVILGLGSILESLILRIELTQDTLIATDLRGRKRYALTEIDRVEEARGCPPALLLKNGRWVKLPSVGSNVGNSIRAWLKRPG